MWMGDGVELSDKLACYKAVKSVTLDYLMPLFYDMSKTIRMRKLIKRIKYAESHGPQEKVTAPK